MRPLRGGAVCSAATTAAKLPRGPPADYNHRSLTATTRTLVSSKYPELLPLVEDGTLIAWQRPVDYADRRGSDYTEPLLVYVVGTSHVSPRSADDVRRVLAAVRPEAVVVELCRSRQAAMYTQQQQQQQQHTGQQQEQPGHVLLASAGSGSDDEGRLPSGGGAVSSSSSSSSSSSKPDNPLSLSGDGGGLLPAFQRSMRLGGATALVLRLLLGRLSARLSGTLGVAAAGGEFVEARRGSEALGAQLVLGDRPIEITLQRAWDALTWRQRARLATELVGGVMSLQQQVGAGLDAAAAVEALKDDDAVSLLFAQLSTTYPALVGPLVHERDLYLAWSLKRSKAVGGAAAVVGVVGRGHMRGVCFALTHDTAGASLRFTDLVGGKNSVAGRRRLWQAAAGRLAVETGVCAALWYAWTALAVSGVQPPP